MTELEQEWKTNAIIELLQLNPKVSLKLLLHKYIQNKTHYLPQWYKLNVT